jgi:hypothetical protein
MTYDFPSHISGDTWLGINAISLNSFGTPVDLTDYNSIFLRVKPEHSIASPVFCELSTNTGDIVVINPPISGIISIPPTIIDIPVGMYNYNLQVEFLNGTKKTYLVGKWEILSTAPETMVSGTNIIVDGGLNINAISDAVKDAISGLTSEFSVVSAKWNETAFEMDTLQDSATARWDQTSDSMDVLKNSLTGTWVGVTNDIGLLSGKWQETAFEMDTLQDSVTAKWNETAFEMDTLQVAATGNWQGTYEYIDRGIIDAGYF